MISACRRAIGVVLMVVMANYAAAAVLSDNLIVNGDFESTANLRNVGSLDSSNNYIPQHRFNQDTDLGMWLGMYGPPSLSEGAGDPGGFSVYDDPRDTNVTGGETRHTGDLGSLNRSVDPFRANNHVMETMLFRPRAAQWIAAPENHVAGPISFSFDFYLNRWDPFGGAVSNAAAETVFQLEIYGTNELPPHDVGYVGDGVAVNPRSAYPDDENGPAENLVARFNWGDWWTWPNTPEVAGNDNGWLSVSSDDLTHWDFNQTNTPGVKDGKQDVLNTELTQTYAYYVMAFRVRVFHEGHVNFWLYSPDTRMIDTVALMFDNVVLQLSVEDEGPAPVPADFNVSGTVNTEDINPFILALTNTPGWIDSIRALLPDGWTDQQIIDYADTNGDGVINTEDINPFICWLTGGSNCGGGAPAIIPEPASLALLGMGALALIRRRFKDCT